jgi:acetyl esterase/lipase
MPLHPDCTAYMQKAAEWGAARGLQAFWEMPHARSRQVYREFITTSGRAMPEMARVEDIRIPTRGGDCPARLLKPASNAARPLPVIVYYFSGGYVIGGIDESEHEARRLAARTPAVVISVGYRVAPEHRFPAAAEDACDALAWVTANAQRFGADAERLAVAGCSAGGGLSAIVATKAAASGGPRLRLAILHCPWLDLTLSQPSIARYAKGYDLDREFLEWFVAAYIGSSGKASDPLASPLLHAIPADMPAIIILAAECDPLFDEARLYAEKLRAARVPVTFIEAPGMIHAFNEITHLIPAAEPLLDPVHAAIRSTLHG